MDIMLILQIIVLLGAIFIGVRLGGIGIGYAGGAGVLVLGLCLGMKPGKIPWDVILIITSVIAAISAMQLAGGLDYLVQIAERILRSNPKYINYLAPVVTYVLTIFAGTGHTAFSMIPVIVEVAKEQKIRPVCPLSIAVVSSQIAITASPVSAAVIYMTGVLEPFGWSYPALLGIWIVTTFIGCMLTAFVMTMIQNLDLDSDPVYKDRLAKGLVKAPEGARTYNLKPGAKLSVGIFLIGVLCVVLYASAISPAVGIIKNVVVGRDAAIMSLMLLVGCGITWLARLTLVTLLPRPCSSPVWWLSFACSALLGLATRSCPVTLPKSRNSLPRPLPSIRLCSLWCTSLLLCSCTLRQLPLRPLRLLSLLLSVFPPATRATPTCWLLPSPPCPRCLFCRPTRRFWVLCRWTTRVRPVSASGCSTTPSSCLACSPSCSPWHSALLLAQCSNCESMKRFA